MKRDRRLPWRELAVIGSVGATFALACAGSDIPPTTSDLRDDLATAYSGSSAGRGGAGGTGGRGGTGGANPGGAAGTASAGTGGAAGAAGGAPQGGAAGAGGGAPQGGSGGGQSETCDGFAVLAANCATSNCHGEGSNLGNFAESVEAAREYIGEEGAICGGQGPLIDPENPEDSVLVLKLGEEAPCGQPMPLSRDPLAQSDIDCIVEWIGGL